MLNVLSRLLLVTTVSLTASQGFAVEGQWQKGKATQIQSSGHRVADGNQCEKFNVETNASFVQVKVRCGGFYKSFLYPLLGGEKNLRVVSGKNTLLITRFAYYAHKVQTQNDSFEMLKVPYVAEVVRIQKTKGSRLSFYRQTFLPDDLGRIVTKSSLQAIAMKPSAKNAARSSQKEKVRKTTSIKKKDVFRYLY